MGKAASAILTAMVKSSHGAQFAKMYLVTILTLTGLLQTSHHQTPLQAQTGYYAHADGGATHVELSMRTCHPVTRMPVEIEIMVNADQGSLFPAVMGCGTHVELSTSSCHPVTRVTMMTVTRMTVETMVNADQGSPFPIIV